MFMMLSPSSLQFLVLVASVSTLLWCAVEALTVKREVRCPVLKDSEWLARDRRCPEGMRYHCFEDGYGAVVAQGCFVVKKCIKGAHPVVEEKRIVCDLCQKGFQPVAGLQSHEYPFSECLPHSPLCDPEYGLSECQAGTAEVDIGCTCNASLGYSPKVSSEDCHCFTQSDPCSGCKFIGCPNGTVKNDRGYCEPEPEKAVLPSSSSSSKESWSTIKTSSTSKPPAADNTIWYIVIAVIFVITIIVTGICCWRRWKEKKQSKEKEFIGKPGKETNNDLTESGPDSSDPNGDLPAFKDDPIESGPESSVNNVVIPQNIHIYNVGFMRINQPHCPGVAVHSAGRVVVGENNYFMPGQTGPDSEGSLGRGSQAPSESSRMNGVSHQPPSREECQAESGEVSSGTDARSPPPVASLGGGPSPSSMPFPTPVSSEEPQVLRSMAVPSQSLVEAPPLSPTATPPSLSMNSSYTAEQEHASVTSETAERASENRCIQRPVIDAEHTERKSPASPWNPGADAYDGADTKTPLVSGPQEQTEAKLSVTPGDSAEGISSEETNLLEIRFIDD